MPEGDTIHRAANRLRPALAGFQLTRFDAPRLAGPMPRPGETIDAVRAHGKHLIIDFSGGLSLRAHLRMTGSWHLYRAGERWQRSARSARVVVGTDEWTAVCFSAPDLAITRRDAVATDHLGPDLCTPGADLDAVVRPSPPPQRPRRPIGEVVMDQRVSSGIGNVYKAEMLFADRLDPTTPIGSLSDDDLRTPLRNGPTPAARQRRQARRTHHRRRWLRRLRTRRRAVSALRRDHRAHHPGRRHATQHLLVPRVPGPAAPMSRPERPALTRTVDVTGIDVRATLRPIAYMRADPTVHLVEGQFVRATITPDGPGTIEIRWRDGTATVDTWGPGAGWLATHAESLLGLARRRHRLRARRRTRSPHCGSANADFV